MAKLSPPQQIAEIAVRIIVAALQVLAIVGGALLIALFPNDVTDNSATADNVVGGVTVSVGSLILIYEIVMIIFAATNLEGVNHSARLLVDIILNVVFAVLCILATLGILVIAVILFVVISAFGTQTIVVAIFAVPIGLGILYSIAFIVSAVTSGIIFSKLNSVATTQPAQVVLAPPPTVAMVPQQTGFGQGNSYPSMGYNQTSFSAVPADNAGQYQTGYPVGGGYLQDPNSNAHYAGSKE